MEKQKIVWLQVQKQAVRDEANKALPGGFEVVYPTSSTDTQEHTRLIAGADYLITQSIYVTREQLLGAKKLKMIQKFGVGVDKIDCQAAAELNIPVCITAGTNSVPVAEMAVGLMLAVNRRIPYVDRSVREGQWLKAEMRAQCYMLAGKTIGLIGMGNISRQVVKRLSGFDVGEMLYYDIFRLPPEREEALGVRYVPLDELMAQSDVVSIHVPLTDETRGMVSRARIAMMKPTAILINTARGLILDQEALIDALRERKIRGAGLDAFEKEPLSSDSPLLELDNLVLTCHHAGSVIDNVLPRARHAYGNIEKFSKGLEIDPRDIVVPKR